jgi:hypothetical protein
MSALFVLKMMDVGLKISKYSEMKRSGFVSIANTFYQNQSYRTTRQDKTGDMCQRMKHNQPKYSVCFIVPRVLCMILNKIYLYIFNSEHTGDVNSQPNLDLLFCLHRIQCHTLKFAN